MIRIEQIMAHPLYIESMAGIQDAERDRIFCRHGLEHCLDVARILYIIVLEQHLDYDKEVIYAIILCLKDYIIGKEEIVKSQYSKSIPSTEQIKKYPNDSLKALLSLYYILRPQETDKYYNFDSVIESCIKIVQDKDGQ